MKRLLPVLLLTFSLAVAEHYRISQRYHSEASPFTQMLYLPSGKYLKPVSFGYDTVVADAIFLWAIQYYTDPGFHPRMDYLKHSYDIISELDPKYLDPYQAGALAMFYEGRNPKAALALLDKGFENNPEEWILPADAGFYCMMNLKDYSQAAEYFRKASAVPGVPNQAKRAWAEMKYRSGDKVESYRIWKDIYDHASHASIRQIAFQHTHDLKVFMDLEGLEKAINSYRKKNNKPPLNLDQLVAAGLVSEVPLDPEGDPYIYESAAGVVKYSKQMKIYSRSE